MWRFSPKTEKIGDEEEEECFISSNSTVCQDGFLCKIDPRYLVNENGTNRCFLTNIDEDNSDTDLNHNNKVETIYKQTQNAVSQMKKSNPELCRSPLINQVETHLDNERQTILNAKFCKSIGRTTENRAIMSKFLIDTDMEMSKIKNQLDTDSSILTSSLIDQSSSSYQPCLNRQQLAIHHQPQINVEIEKTEEPIGICT